jgi:hypothetical protein
MNQNRDIEEGLDFYRFDRIRKEDETFLLSYKDSQLRNNHPIPVALPENQEISQVLSAVLQGDSRESNQGIFDYESGYLEVLTNLDKVYSIRWENGEVSVVENKDRRTP